jgi:DNA-binding MarR family transcriptional regulator
MFILSLSEKGTHLAEEIIESHKKIHEDILNQIPTAYQDQIIESIAQLNEALKSWLSYP